MKRANDGRPVGRVERPVGPILDAIDEALCDLRDWAQFCRETHERAQIGIAPTAPRLAGFERTHDVMDGLRKARAVVVGLLRDKQRLDWLADRDNPIGNVQLPTECVNANLADMRGAIDAAMLLRPNAN